MLIVEKNILLMEKFFMTPEIFFIQIIDLPLSLSYMHDFIEIILNYLTNFILFYFSPRKYRGSRTSASLKVKGLLGRVWARDSKSKSCENLHVL